MGEGTWLGCRHGSADLIALVNLHVDRTECPSPSVHFSTKLTTAGKLTLFLTANRIRFVRQRRRAGQLGTARPSVETAVVDQNFSGQLKSVAPSSQTI